MGQGNKDDIYNIEKVVAANQIIVKGDFKVEGSEDNERRLEYDRKRYEIKTGTLRKYSRVLDEVNETVNRREVWKIISKKYGWRLEGKHMDKFIFNFNLGHRALEINYKSLLDVEYRSKVDVSYCYGNMLTLGPFYKEPLILDLGLQELSSITVFLEEAEHLLKKNLSILRDSKKAASYVTSITKQALKFRNHLKIYKLIREEGLSAGEASDRVFGSDSIENEIYLCII